MFLSSPMTQFVPSSQPQAAMNIPFVSVTWPFRTISYAWIIKYSPLCLMFCLTSCFQVFFSRVTAMYEGFHCSASLPWVLAIIEYRHPDDKRSICNFIFISLRTNEAEQMFIWLLFYNVQSKWILEKSNEKLHTNFITLFYCSQQAKLRL